MNAPYLDAFAAHEDRLIANERIARRAMRALVPYALGVIADVTANYGIGEAATKAVDEELADAGIGEEDHHLARANLAEAVPDAGAACRVIERVLAPIRDARTAGAASPSTLPFLNNASVTALVTFVGRIATLAPDQHQTTTLADLARKARSLIATLPAQGAHHAP